MPCPVKTLTLILVAVAAAVGYDTYSGNFIGQSFKKGFTLKMLGIHISFLLLCFKTSPSSWLEWMYMFDDYTPVLGFIIFLWTSQMVVRDASGNSGVTANLVAIWCVAAAMVTVYHNHWVLGVVTVLLIFVRAGFPAENVTSQECLMRCMSIAFTMVPGFILTKLSFPELYSGIQMFETGVMFWGPFIGLLSTIIYTDEDNPHFKLHHCIAILLNFCMSGLYLVVICLSSTPNIFLLEILGSIFLCLWIFNGKQRNILFGRLFPMKRY